MPLSYAFVLVVPAANLERAMVTLASHMEDMDSARLLAARPWEPAVTHQLASATAPHGHGLRDLRRKMHEGHDGFCFTYRFAIGDEALHRYEEEESARSFRREPDTMARVGCIYTRVGRGQRWLLIEASSPTSSMSRLFSGSTSVRAAWVAMAGAMGARALLLDREEEHWWLLPDECAVPKPEEEEEEFAMIENTLVFDVDARANTMLALAGMGSLSRFLRGDVRARARAVG